MFFNIKKLTKPFIFNKDVVIAELLKEVESLKESNAKLQSKIQKQSREVRRLNDINFARKKVIADYSRFRDEVIQWNTYVTAVLDAYGHKDKKSLNFDLRALTDAPSVKKVLDEKARMERYFASYEFR